MRIGTIDVRSIKVAAFGTAVTLGGIAAPLTAEAAPGHLGSCPTPTEVVAHFDRGLDALVDAGDLTRGEASEAGEQFAAWARTEGAEGFDCDRIRSEMVGHGRGVLGVVGLDLGGVRRGFEDGQSLAEMADANGAGRGELVETLTNLVGDGLDRLERAGAFDRSVAEAFEELAAERIEFAVDYEQGDPLPPGFDHDRS